MAFFDNIIFTFDKGELITKEKYKENNISKHNTLKENFTKLLGFAFETESKYQQYVYNDLAKRNETKQFMVDNFAYQDLKHYAQVFLEEGALHFIKHSPKQEMFNAYVNKTIPNAHKLDTKEVERILQPHSQSIAGLLYDDNVSHLADLDLSKQGIHIDIDWLSESDIGVGQPKNKEGELQQEFRINVKMQNIAYLVIHVTEENYLNYVRLLGAHNSLDNKRELLKGNTATFVIPFNFCLHTAVDMVESQLMSMTEGKVLTEELAREILVQYMGSIMAYHGDLYKGKVSTYKLHAPNNSVTVHTIMRAAPVDCAFLVYNNDWDTVSGFVVHPMLAAMNLYESLKESWEDKNSDIHKTDEYNKIKDRPIEECLDFLAPLVEYDTYYPFSRCYSAFSLPIGFECVTRYNGFEKTFNETATETILEQDEQSARH